VSFAPGDMIAVIESPCLIAQMARRLLPVIRAGMRGTVARSAGDSYFLVEFPHATARLCHCEMRKLDPEGDARTIVNWNESPWQPPRRKEPTPV
jgi:hypothetical protein